MPTRVPKVEENDPCASSSSVSGVCCSMRKLPPLILFDVVGCRGGCGGPCLLPDYAARFSKIPAAPMPPPMHMVTMP